MFPSSPCTSLPHGAAYLSKWLFCSLDPNGLEQGLHQKTAEGWWRWSLKPSGFSLMDVASQNAAPFFIFSLESRFGGGCCKVLWSSTLILCNILVCFWWRSTNLFRRKVETIGHSTIFQPNLQASSIKWVVHCFLLNLGWAWLFPFPGQEPNLHSPSGSLKKGRPV